VNKDRTQGEFWFVNTISTRGGTDAYSQGWFVNNGERHLRLAAGPSQANSNLVGVQAPEWPIGYDPNCNDSTATGTITSASRETVLLGVYPNPFNSEIMLQLTLHVDSETTGIVYDVMGREVARKDFGKLNAGMHELPLNLDKLAVGNYYLVMKMGNKTNQRKLIKTN
jgi:hypothetical protein